MENNSIFIIAGEASGDIHGAHLINELVAEQKQLKIYAMGSQHIAATPAQVIVDSKELAVVGFFEVLGKLKLIRTAFKKILHQINEKRPKLVILIDYPGFNLRLAKAVKKISQDIKILYYISPQIWAWRYKRIYHIKKYIDLMVVLFPFEVLMYEKENVPVKLVKHPLIDQVKTILPAHDRHAFFGLNKQAKIIALMPGSREHEIKSLLPIMLKSAEILQNQFSELQFILPLAPTIKMTQIESIVKKSPTNVKIVTEKNYDAIAMCDAVIVASGTATLELALLEKPMVIIYKASAISYAIAKKLVKIEHIGLCNIVAQEGVVKELVQAEASPENIAQEITQILINADYRDAVTNKLQDTANKLKQSNYSDQLASLVLDMLSE